VKPQVAIPSELDAALERLYGAGRTAVGQIVGDVEQRDELAFDADIQQLKDLASEAPVIRLVSLLITNALEARASDIHIEPFENRLAVRYRIDGVLHEVDSPPRRFSAAVISRVKIMANLDIAERRLPQDGRIRLRVHGKDIDLRISTVPTMHGESVVMRILDKGGVALDFARLGFEDDILERFLAVLMQPHGILLVTGPHRLRQDDHALHGPRALEPTRREDPHRSKIPSNIRWSGINQIQVKPQINLTFANALRSIVRQDPDVIMIGEIRDLETAEIAVQSALTGHLVLSTVHTNDAASTMNRLLDMGVEDYLLTSTVIGVLAQRLVRTLCPHCKEAHSALPEIVEQMRLDRFTDAKEITLYRPSAARSARIPATRAGSASWKCCRSPIAAQPRHEARQPDRAPQPGGERGDADDVRGRLRKAVRGITTFEEVLRVTREG
jgi:general secretion pathway protein E